MKQSYDPTQPTLRDSVRPFIPRFGWTTLYFSSVIALGAAGYHTLEHWSWGDSFFMSVITATSVGYGEIQPLSDGGRIFTAVLLAFSIIGLGGFWALMTAFIVEVDLGGFMRRRRTMREIDDLRDHFIVCGTGRMGRVVVDELVRDGVDFVCIEQSERAAELLFENHPDALVIDGDATKDHVLEEAGLHRARGLAACLSSDADNLFLCLTARELRRDIVIAARAAEEETISKLRHAGADHVILPNVTGGVRMATMVTKPTIAGFLDATMRTSDIEMRLDSVTIPESSILAGQTLATLEVPRRTGLIVLALRHSGSEEYRYNPGPSEVVAAGDNMVVLGTSQQMMRLKAYVDGGGGGGV